MIRFLPFLLFISLFSLNSCANDTPADQSAVRYELGDRPRSSDGQVLDPLSRTTTSRDALIQNIRYTEGDFDFAIANYTLGQETSGSSGLPCPQDPRGQHISLLIDDLPAARYYEPSFRHELSDGEHYMVTFLTTSYGESVKVQRAARIAKIVAKENSFTAMENISQPMIFLNMPEGPIQQAGPGEGILLDFFLINAALGADYKVKVVIDGSEIILNNWQPYLMRNLALGEHQLELSLITQDGSLESSPFNPIRRSFTIIE